jgi:hypothetical protein
VKIEIIADVDLFRLRYDPRLPPEGQLRRFRIEWTKGGLGVEVVTVDGSWKVPEESATAWLDDLKPRVESGENWVLRNSSFWKGGGGAKMGDVFRILGT